MEILETILLTAHVAGTIPISAILIGPSGAGKSKGVMQFRDADGCHLTTDVTSIGIQEILSRDKEGKIRFLIVPDFNLVLSHRASTLQLTIANLLSVTSEGTVRIDDGRVVKEVKHAPVGIITAMTRELYAHVARKWSVIGFNRRFLPVYYDYSTETRFKIQDGISTGSVSLMQLASKQVEPPPMQTVVEMGDESKTIQQLSTELAENIGWLPINRHRKEGEEEKPTEGIKTASRKAGAVFIGKQLEFSPHLSLRTMAQAHALKEKRTAVSREDVAFLMRLITFTRYDRPFLL